MSQRVFIVGGTGFLGYHAAQEFSTKGWSVTVLGLPPAPPVDLFPAEVRVIVQNINDLADADLRQLLSGHDALVFAAGLDDRHVPQRPAYPKFRQANVVALTRLMQLAQQAGVKRLVVLGSYFAHFNWQWPHLRLAERHPYICSRVEQEQAATSLPRLDGMVLELPYIFGALPVTGWKPLWTPLVKYLRSSRTILYMKGGTACISAQTVGRAIVAAIENGTPGARYPIGQENLPWAEMLQRLADVDGRKIWVVTLPTWIIRLGLWSTALLHRLQGKESGLNMLYFAGLQTAQTYLDPEPSQRALGYVPGDLEAAFRQTVEACGAAK
jgi:dihydroflavonol-4-reductase